MTTPPPPFACSTRHESRAAAAARLRLALVGRTDLDHRELDAGHRAADLRVTADRLTRGVSAVVGAGLLGNVLFGWWRDSAGSGESACDRDAGPASFATMPTLEHAILSADQ